MPATQALLILALFIVAILFIRLDGKLNAMKKGTDGVRDTIIEVNHALNRAQSAITELKSASNAELNEISTKIEEAKAATEALRFATTAAKAIGANNSFVKEILPQTTQSRSSKFDDLPPIDSSRRNHWGGLR